MRGFKAALFVFATTTAGLVASLAYASPVYCPGNLTGQEYMLDTTPDSGCLATGGPNINGNGDDINGLGYETLDVSNDSDFFDGALSITINADKTGTFSVNTALLLGYVNFVLGIKDGGEPKWAAFTLPVGVAGGAWAIIKNYTATTFIYKDISHAILYGVCDDVCSPNPGLGVVPLPATLPLFGSALAGAGLLGWRKRRKTA